MTTTVELGAADFESTVNTNPIVPSAAAGISSIPTLMAFRDGMLVFSQPGALPAPALEQVIAAVRALDMTALRAEAARLGETADHQAGSTR